MFVALALLLTQTASPPAVVYLKCETTQGGQQKSWDLTLNESAGTVDYYTQVSGQQRTQARFTSNAVYFIGFTLSRVDLTLQRRAFGEIERGTCQVVQPKGRAF
ncbi:MAG: hypothetical protein KF730_05475 [Sphingomonas sp.]|uniref:hypothetical protein n=1 Tax=Sphingomonas sp. TaxID=28214 RepID=UPI0025F19861|nr:hypothetical protein [Sphingomonas sp.]MBX3564012.1 hypothetical protein [Sphingomonas sp.]